MAYAVASTIDGNTSWGTNMRTFISDIDTRATALETPTLNTQTGTTYTAVLTDKGKVVERSSASANTFTIPPNTSVAFAVGTVIYIRQMGTGLTTIAAGAGVTIRSRGNALNMGGQYAEAAVTKRATDEWVLSGDIT